MVILALSRQIWCWRLEVPVPEPEAWDLGPGPSSQSSPGHREADDGDAETTGSTLAGAALADEWATTHGVGLEVRFLGLGSSPNDSRAVRGAVRCGAVVVVTGDRERGRLRRGPAGATREADPGTLRPEVDGRVEVVRRRPEEWDPLSPLGNRAPHKALTGGDRESTQEGDTHPPAPTAHSCTLLPLLAPSSCTFLHAHSRPLKPTRTFPHPLARPRPPFLIQPLPNGSPHVPVERYLGIPSFCCSFPTASAGLRTADIRPMDMTSIAKMPQLAQGGELKTRPRHGHGAAARVCPVAANESEIFSQFLFSLFFSQLVRSPQPNDTLRRELRLTVFFSLPPWTGPLCDKGLLAERLTGRGFGTEGGTLAKPPESKTANQDVVSRGRLRREREFFTSVCTSFVHAPLHMLLVAPSNEQGPFVDKSTAASFTRLLARPPPQPTT